MNKLFTFLATMVLSTASVVFADGHANKVTIQLKWVTQAQFAGYYVA